jgi:hypothetical protein
MRWGLVVIFGVACRATDIPVERHQIVGGSELLTVFGRLPDGKLVSVLRSQ